MNLEQLLRKHVIAAIQQLYNETVDGQQVSFNETKKEFAGDITLVVFPFTRISKKSPEQCAQDIGQYLQDNVAIVSGFNVIKGFLNIEISEAYWLQFLASESKNPHFGKGNLTGISVLEYCGPNTNKPLHLGHIRNMLLGYSTASLLEFAGKEVHKVNIYNDRGIAICKSMLAYKLFGNGETPESSGIKGDHLVGKYYVVFDQKLKEEIAQLVNLGKTKEEAEKQCTLLIQAREMLLKWENGDPETRALWEKMNGWCYDGFEETFKKLGVDFEKHYKESEYFERGKELVEEGISKGVYTRKADKSAWVDLTDKGLDEKLLLRSDGTSVYITQDMGVAEARYNDFQFDESIYVVASEQDYHFKVLQLTLEKLGKKYAEGIYHLSYGLVNLPDGRMKSREGTVVDADDLIEEMIKTAEQHTNELGKVDDFTKEESEKLYCQLAMGALKYFILKVNPKRNMIFNPNESIDFQGNTGPFVQFNYVRIQSLLRKQSLQEMDFTAYQLNQDEKEVIKEIYKFPSVVLAAAQNYDVSLVCNYAYELAKSYSKFYASNNILNDVSEETKQFRLQLSKWLGSVLQTAFRLLGIEMPERM